jgi:hypothetical protein
VLVFVLRRSGVSGHITAGRIERDGPVGLNVYTGPDGKINEYISGSNLRSWCVLGPDGHALPEWQHIEDEDRYKILPL